MSDKIVNHFVLADGSVARYSAEHLAGDVPEVVGIRTGYDGTVYPSAGDAVRGQVGKTANELKAIHAIKKGYNLVNPDNLVTGFIQSNGTVATNGVWADYTTTDYIELEPNTDYVFTEYQNTLALYTNRKGLILFDSDKQPITGTYQNVGSTSYLTFNSASAKYVRLSSRRALKELGKGTDATDAAFVAYSETDELLTNLGENATEQVENQIDNFVLTVGKNIVDTSNAIDGYVLEASGNLGPSANYSTYGYYEVEPETDYVFATFSSETYVQSTTRKYVLIYDSDRKPIPSSYLNVTNQYYITFTTPENAAYIRVSTSSAVLPQVEKGTTPTNYNPFEKTMNYPLGGDALAMAQSGNALSGKKWAVCGDSFTNGSAENSLIASGKYTGQRSVYPYLIGNRNNMEIVKFFDGGRTLAFPETPGTFTNALTNPAATWYYQNIPADVDYITIYLGINDEHHAPGSGGGDGEDNTGVIPIGTIDDATTATYYGAWNVVLTWLITNRPNAHIGIIVTNGNQSKDEYRLAQIAISEKYGIPYIDLNGDVRTPAMLRTSNPNIPSSIKQALIQKWAIEPSTNTHPNDDAHEFESTFIENFLRTI